MKKDFQAFIQDVIKELKTKLGNSYTIYCRLLRKHNGTSSQMIIISDNAHNASPCYSMEKYYELYQKPEDAGTIAADILKIYHQENIQDFQLEWIHRKDKMLELVMFRIVSTDRNAGLLADVPHHDLPGLNLSMLFYILVDTGNREHASILLWNRHEKTWGLTEADLLEHAWKNTILTMGYTISNINDISGEPASTARCQEAEIPLYVITNTLKLYGAGCILYPDVLKEAAQKLDSDFYILPSSVHETIAVPAAGFKKSEAEVLKKMVMKINQYELRCEEMLSDNVYYYSRKQQELSLGV